MIFLEIKQQYLCCSRKKPINFQATTDSERERHAGIPPRDEEEMEMSDDSSTLTGESLEAVTPTITPRYYLGNNLFYFVVCFDIPCSYKKTHFVIWYLSFFGEGWTCNVMIIEENYINTKSFSTVLFGCLLK